MTRNQMPAALVPPITLTASLRYQANDNGRAPEPSMPKAEGAYLAGGDWGQWGDSLPF